MYDFEPEPNVTEDDLCPQHRWSGCDCTAEDIDRFLGLIEDEPEEDEDEDEDDEVLVS